MLVGDNETAMLISQYEIRTRTIQLLAPSLCGILISFSLFFPYILSLIISLLSIILLSQLKFHDKNIYNKKEPLLNSLLGAYDWLKYHNLYMKMVLLTAINNFLHPILYLTIIYQLNSHHIGDEIIGYILSGLGIGGLIGSLISGYVIKQLSFFQIIFLVNIMRILVFLGFWWVDNEWGYFFFFVCKAILGGIWNVFYNSFSIESIPGEYITRVSGLSGLVIKIFTAVATLCSGYFISYLGVNMVLLLLVLLTLMMFLLTLNVKKDLI